MQNTNLVDFEKYIEFLQTFPNNPKRKIFLPKEENLILESNKISPKKPT